jgi:hypothetical protein
VEGLVGEGDYWKWSVFEYVIHDRVDVDRCELKAV